MIALVIPVLAVLVQQQQPGRRPTPASQPAQRVDIRTANPDHPATPYDSTVAAIREVGAKVADVKSYLELYRRAAFNDPSGVVLQNADLFRNSCRALAEETDSGRHVLCRHCLSADAQRAVERYRAYLSSLAQLGRQCAARMVQVRGGSNGAAAVERLRREARPMSARIVAGLTPYEARLREVRIAFGWESPTVTPRR
jgi:hypothetical protein